MPRVTPLVLAILDGFGVSVDSIGNPVAEAKKPALDLLERNFPFTTLQASGVAVGLPWGEAGNSEVGHLTMGAGRVLHHHLPRIIYAIRDGSFFRNPAFAEAAAHVRAHNSRLHIAGLVSSGSVHSYLEHLMALAEFAGREGLPDVRLHIFSDGRDAPPREAASFIASLAKRLEREAPRLKFATVIGRFFAMDRDEKWDRIQKAYELLTQGKGEYVSSIPQYLEQSYANGLNDDSIEPAIVMDDPLPVIRENDALIFLNFREDSMRELTRAFAEEGFDKFPRARIPNLCMVSMTEYERGLAGVMPAFSALEIAHPLGQVLADAGLRQLRIAETEKYAHVTYFFNGGEEKPFPGEDRILVPSVATAHFDEVPEMRAKEIVAKILENLAQYDVVIANFANADMVGHSGNFAASVRAVEALDAALTELVDAVTSEKGAMLVTGDHGNIELKRNVFSGEKRTEHSINPVPFLLVGEGFGRPTPRTEAEVAALKKEIGGILTDVAPTMLELLDIPKPAEMTGQSLLAVLLGQR